MAPHGKVGEARRARGIGASSWIWSLPTAAAARGGRVRRRGRARGGLFLAEDDEVGARVASTVEEIVGCAAG